MSETEAPPTPEAEPTTGPKLEAGAYEVIRGRLDQHADDLRTRLATLNTARKDVFGAIPFAN